MPNHPRYVTSVPRPLSPREREVLTYAAAGATDVVIGKILFITVPSVRTHVENAMRKLNAKNKTQAVAQAIRNGEIT